jgi:predicted nucleic acid-binding protein
VTPYAYLDASAIVKLVVEEPESPRVQADILTRPGLLCSQLGATEVSRACRRVLPRRQFQRIDDILEALFLVAVTPAILEAAGTLEPAVLRTLDAIHLATLLSLDDRAIDVVTYDSRLAAAAKAHGFNVVVP